ncbi:uncharacterized protein LOC114725484 [Neltuma alba]|uniref:uncharacterized protein LOC114725484 n=1 Tax=Neltuma alba TaxID=207710 RepID=UPI0010A3F3D3|nr:uncharacterized protein LOC114725484 [Prosopis alba]
MLNKENVDPSDLIAKRGGKVDIDPGEMACEEEEEDPMSALFLIWNSRDAASKGFVAALKGLKSSYRLDVVAILEPRVSDGVQVENVVKDEQFIHCKVREGEEECVLTTVYGSPNEQKRQHLWGKLKMLADEINEPWMVVGDFSDIKSPLEQKGGGRVNEARCRRFTEWIQECELIDIDATGPFFTWKGPKWEGLDRVYKRLDRCFTNYQWQCKFVNAEVRVAPRICSNRHPIYVDLDLVLYSNSKRIFRFEATWQLNEQFQPSLN